MIFNVIEATAGPTGLCVVWLTEMKRIVSHALIPLPPLPSGERVRVRGIIICLLLCQTKRCA
jgi:hypothetical protein